MNAAQQLFRSALYVPGDNQRALEKAKTLPADVVILDLEDAVAPDAKIAARQQVCAALARGDFKNCSLSPGERAGVRGPEVTIRINAIGTPWHIDDLHAAITEQPEAIVVPKVNSASDLQTIESELTAAGANSQLQIWAVLETAKSILHAEEIAQASPRLTVLIMGTNDLVNELHTEHVPGREPLLFALSKCILAARSAGKVILDGVYNDIANLAGFEAECIQARSLGFDGKTLIHPAQIPACNRAFTPSPTEIDRAHKTIAAFEQALSQGKAIATVDGRMIENLHVESARRILAIAQMISEIETR